MNALCLKQLHQAPVFGEDTDVIYLHSCNLNTKFDFTVPSLQFLRLNVVFGQFIFVSSLVERRWYLLPANRRILDKLDGVRFQFILQVIEKSSKEGSVFFLGAKESFSLRNCSSRNSTLFSSRRRALGLFWNVTKAATFWRILRYIFYTVAKEITLLKGTLCIYKCFIYVLIHFGIAV